VTQSPLDCFPLSSIHLQLSVPALQVIVKLLAHPRALRTILLLKILVVDDGDLVESVIDHESNLSFVACASQHFQLGKFALDTPFQRRLPSSRIVLDDPLAKICGRAL
jgi:hypothetical protein